MVGGKKVKARRVSIPVRMRIGEEVRTRHVDWNKDSSLASCEPDYLFDVNSVKQHVCLFVCLFN